MEGVHKKLKTDDNSGTQNDASEHEKLIYIRFKDPEGSEVGEVLHMNVNTKAKELEEHVNLLLGNEERQLYSFFYES